MKLSVATNFDNALLDCISSYPVDDIYGKLTNDFVGGGRASYTTQGITPSILEAHVEYAHQKGIKFNYLLNSACLGNREWTRSGLKAIRKLLDWLANIGVDSLTVSVPYLAEIVKRHYPHFFLKVGIYANIDSPERAVFWQDIGADLLTLESFSINRNFSILEYIRKAVSCRLQLIANFTCLSRCPMQPYHMAGLSHASTSSDKNPFVDYCALKCSCQLLEDPRLLIRSQWIRPEDIAYYEKVGYSDFKLLERNAPTDSMVNRVVSYAERRSPPNLLELIQPYGFSKDVKKIFGWQIRHFFSFIGSPVNIQNMMGLLKKRGLIYSLKKSPVFLDSKKLPDNFLDSISRAGCMADGSCSNCGYCKSVVENAYTVDGEYRDECLKLYHKVFDQLCSR